ncbi:MAG: hypothetical protein J5618_01535, partial [Bacilli bacterium]|nr:hypothetical protein [Bacilli bacterium]
LVGIVLSILRQRKRYIFYILSFLLSVAAALDFVANFDAYLKVFTDKSLFDKSLNTLGLVYGYGLIIGGLLAYLTLFFVYFLGLGRARVLLQAAEEEVPAPVEEPAPAEEPVPEESPEAPAEDEEEDFALAAVNNEPEATEEVKEEEQPEEQPLADFAVEPEELPAQPEEVVVEEVPQDDDPEKAPVTRQDLASILRDVVRDIVRDEIARANADKEEEKKEEKPQFTNNGGFPAITGATFGGPLVVQYFNGGINAPAEPAPAPAPQPAPKAEPAPAPAPAEEPKAEEPAPQPEPEPAPAPAVEPVLGPVVEEKPKNPIIRIPFVDRLLDSEQDVQDIYNEIKNELLSWGLHSRVSNSGDAFRLHTKTYCKVTVAGKSLKLYLALDPADYADSTLPIQDASEKGLYVDIPLVFKVKSGLSVRRAKQLIKDACEKDGLSQEEVGTVNWIKELKAEQKAKK